MNLDKKYSKTVFGEYDPTYDPLTQSYPGVGKDYAPTYWVGTAGEPPADDGPINADIEVDVVIVGSGFTGLATALFLAKEHGIKATILEANQKSWGCTSRNGGQGQNASGRLYRSQWIEKWGIDTAKKLDEEIREGFQTFKDLVAQFPECEPQPGGHLYIAHKEKKMDFLNHEAKIMKDVFGYDTRILSGEEVRNEWVNDAESFGAMHEPDGIGVHPLKLAFGYTREARKLGVKIHPASPVMSIQSNNGWHYLKTPGGTVKSKVVAFATGGYTSNQLHSSLESKIMPILSNSLVTRPLNQDELHATNFITNQVITDTRTLRFYYRKLPDNRIQIGSRSAITGADAPNPIHMNKLIDGLHRKFPALKGIGIDYSWWGWVDVSHDMMPRIYKPNASEEIYYAAGYGGNGVSFSAHAGKRMAEMIAGKKTANKNLPIYNSELEYPNLFNVIKSKYFAPYRRIGQSFLYHWYHQKDESK